MELILVIVPVMNSYSIKTEKVVGKVYHLKELQKILDDVIIQYVNDVATMSDKELDEDRSEWVKHHGRIEDDEKDWLNYDTSIQTIALEIEQLRRFKKIVYVNEKHLQE